LLLGALKGQDIAKAVILAILTIGSLLTMLRIDVHSILG
jgi:hypothetical protein